MERYVKMDLPEIRVLVSGVPIYTIGGRPAPTVGPMWVASHLIPHLQEGCLHFQGDLRHISLVVVLFVDVF
jgi:hypothetical protein